MGPSNSSYLSNTAIFHFHDYGRNSIFLLKEWDKLLFGTNILSFKSRIDLSVMWPSTLTQKFNHGSLWGSCPLPLERTVACWIVCVCMARGKKWKGNIQLMDEVETNVSYEILLYFKRFERHLYKLSACLIVAKLNLFSPLVLDCCSICFCRTFISKVFFATATVSNLESCWAGQANNSKQWKEAHTKCLEQKKLALL